MSALKFWGRKKRKIEWQQNNVLQNIMAAEIYAFTVNEEILCMKKADFLFFFPQSYGMADVIGSFIDLDTMTIKWSKNGIDLGNAYTIPAQLRNSSFFPAVCLKVGGHCGFVY